MRILFIDIHCILISVLKRNFFSYRVELFEYNSIFVSLILIITVEKNHNLNVTEDKVYWFYKIYLQYNIEL